MLASVLRGAGASVTAAASAEETLTLGVETPPDVIVSDIAMPGQDGYGLVRQIVAALGSRAPRVRIALTAFATSGDREKALAAGFQRHISKPFDPLALVDIVHEMLDLDSPAAS